MSLTDYLNDLSTSALSGSSGTGGTGIVQPSSTDDGFFSGVNDLFSNLGGLYIQSKMLENMNPVAYSNYGWQYAGGNSNGATMQPFNAVVAQQQQQQSEAALKSKGTTQLLLIGGAVLALFLLLRK